MSIGMVMNMMSSAEKMGDITNAVSKASSSDPVGRGGMGDVFTHMIFGELANSETGAGEFGSFANSLGKQALASFVPWLAVPLAITEGIEGGLEIFRGDFMEGVGKLASAAMMGCGAGAVSTAFKGLRKAYGIKKRMHMLKGLSTLTKSADDVLKMEQGVLKIVTGRREISALMKANKIRNVKSLADLSKLDQTNKAVIEITKRYKKYSKKYNPENIVKHLAKMDARQQKLIHRSLNNIGTKARLTKAKATPYWNSLMGKSFFKPLLKDPNAATKLEKLSAYEKYHAGKLFKAGSSAVKANPIMGSQIAESGAIGGLSKVEIEALKAMTKSFATA